MILPFPKKGSILAQSSVLVLVTIQLCSRGARGTGQVPTAEQQIQCHIVFSRIPMGYTPITWPEGWLVGAAGSLCA